jgi:hypothetical protein
MEKLQADKVFETNAQAATELSDILINKQSFSANPRDLKKQTESGNFL